MPPAPPRTTFQASLACADGGGRLIRRVTRWTHKSMAIDRMSITATATALGAGWQLVNQVTVDVRRQRVYGHPHHLDGARYRGVDEHVRNHTRRPGEPSTFVTVLVDLTPLVDARGPARLMDMRPGRSVEVLRSWLQERTPSGSTSRWWRWMA